MGQIALVDLTETTVRVPPLINTLRPRQNGRHFPDDIFKYIVLNENIRISIKHVKISLKFVPKGSINNIPALVQIMAWRRPGDKPLSEPMMDSLLMHICVTRPQWVKSNHYSLFENWLPIDEIYRLIAVTCQEWNGIGTIAPREATRVPFQYEDWLSMYEGSQHKDKMVLRPYYLSNGNS